MKSVSLLMKITAVIAFIIGASTNQSMAEGCETAFTGTVSDEVDAACVGAAIDPTTVTGSLAYLNTWFTKNCDTVGMGMMKTSAYTSKSASKATPEQCSIVKRVAMCKEVLNKCTTTYKTAKTAAGDNEAKATRATENKTKCEDSIKLKACKGVEALAVVPEE